MIGRTCRDCDGPAPLGARANWAIALMLLRLAALVAVAWLLEWSLAIRFIEGIVLSAIVDVTAKLRSAALKRQ